MEGNRVAYKLSPVWQKAIIGGSIWGALEITGNHLGFGITQPDGSHDGRNITDFSWRFYRFGNFG